MAIIEFKVGQIIIWKRYKQIGINGGYTFTYEDCDQFKILEIKDNRPTRVQLYKKADMANGGKLNQLFDNMEGWPTEDMKVISSLVTRNIPWL